MTSAWSGRAGSEKAVVADNTTWIDGPLRYLTWKLHGAREFARNVKHSTARGGRNELAVRAFLRSVLPSRYGLMTGEVINARGERSLQQDVIVIDREGSMSFWLEEDSSVVPAEVVVATFEVKTTITTDEVRKAVKNVASVKKLLEPTDDGAGLGAPFGGVIGLNRDGSKDSIIDAYGYACVNEPSPLLRADALFVLDEFLVIPGDKEQGRASTEFWSDNRKNPGRQLVCEEKERAALLLVDRLSEHIRRYRPPPLDLIDYVGGDTVEWKIGLFRPEGRNDDGRRG